MNNDLISRRELKKKFAEYGEKAKFTQGACQRLIDNAPTVSLPDFKEGYKQAILDGKTNFSRPQGEWIKTQEGRWIYPICSECGYKENVVTNYCANCGAKMDKEGK